MLALNPGLMRSMSDEQLIASLEVEGNLIDVELELLARLTAATDKLAELDGIEARLEKHYERQLEQSEFRGQLLEEIVELCAKKPGRLAKAITSAIENSYVEL